MLETARVAPDLNFSNPARARSGRSRIGPDLRTQVWPEPEPDWLKIDFGSQNNTPAIKLMASTMLSAAIEAVQFSASFVVLLFASLR